MNIKINRVKNTWQNWLDDHGDHDDAERERAPTLNIHVPRKKTNDMDLGYLTVFQAL